MAQAHTGRLWDDLPYEDWTYAYPHQRPTWDSDNMSICYRVSGALKPARFHAGRWQYRVSQETNTWKNCGMKKNLILRTYKQQVVQNTIVVEGGEEDSHRCNICLEDVQFPMSNGCCSFKFCKDCYDMMPPEQKRICSGCRAPTPFTGQRSAPLFPEETHNGRTIREWEDAYIEQLLIKNRLQRERDEYQTHANELIDQIGDYQTRLRSVNTCNEELLEQVETHKSDNDLLETCLHLEEKKVKELKEQIENSRIREINSKALWKGKVLDAEKNTTKYQMMYNKVIRMSIMLMVMLVFSVLR